MIHPAAETAGARKTPSWAQSTQVQIIAKEKEDVKIFLSLFHKYFSVILCVFTEGSAVIAGTPGDVAAGLSGVRAAGTRFPLRSRRAAWYNHWVKPPREGGAGP